MSFGEPLTALAPLGRGMLRLARASARVARRRVRFGPRRAGWSLGYEIMVDVMRIQFSANIPFEQQRAEMDSLGQLEQARRRCRIEELVAGGVPALRVTPNGGAGKTVILYLHGGGYCLGSPRSHLGVAAGLAIACRASVISLDYRRAPEHPCPAAIEDAGACYRWLLAEQGVNPSSIVIAGDSAGGGLTMATLVDLREQGLPLPACAVPISPWGDLRVEADDARGPAPDDFLDAASSDRMATAYAGELARDDGRVSPVFAEMSGLPPLLVMAGGAEYLLPDSERIAERARECGVDVRLDIEPDEVHVYPIMSDINPRGGAALERIADFVREHV